MKVNEILSLETRCEENLFNIYLVPEGDWYRQYEWSAYLLNNIPSKRVQEKKPLKISKKKINGVEEGVISSGMKEASFPNYLPENFKDGILKFHETDIIIINVSEYFKDSDITFETYTKALKDFKEKIEYLPTKSQNIKSTNPKLDIINNLVDSILEFSVFDSTPFDCCKFIQTLQRKIINEFSSK